VKAAEAGRSARGHQCSCQAVCNSEQTGSIPKQHASRAEPRPCRHQPSPVCLSSLADKGHSPPLQPHVSCIDHVQLTIALLHWIQPEWLQLQANRPLGGGGGADDAGQPTNLLPHECLYTIHRQMEGCTCAVCSAKQPPLPRPRWEQPSLPEAHTLGALRITTSPKTNV
jgi:hypothetical protein